MHKYNIKARVKVPAAELFIALCASAVLLPHPGLFEQVSYMARLVIGHCKPSVIGYTSGFHDTGATLQGRVNCAKLVK